jgi:hypothetical protein
MPSFWWAGASGVMIGRHIERSKARRARGELMHQRMLRCIAVAFSRWNAKHKKEKRQEYLRRGRDAQIRAAQAKVHPRYRKKLPY